MQAESLAGVKKMLIYKILCPYAISYEFIAQHHFIILFQFPMFKTLQCHVLLEIDHCWIINTTSIVDKVLKLKQITVYNSGDVCRQI